MYKTNIRYDLISVIGLFMAIVATTGYLRFTKIVSADENTIEKSEISLPQSWQTIDNQYSLSMEKNDMIILYGEQLFSLADASEKGIIEYSLLGKEKVQPGQSWKIKSNKKEVKLITK